MLFKHLDMSYKPVKIRLIQAKSKLFWIIAFLLVSWAWSPSDPRTDFVAWGILTGQLGDAPDVPPHRGSSRRS
jgi:hypothetical protein